MAKPNYQFEKRQKELAKKSKKEEKRQKKVADNPAADDIAQQDIEIPATESNNVRVP